MNRSELREVLEAKIKDAYYDARNNGGTMHTAAVDAAAAVLPYIDRYVAQEVVAELEIRATS